MTENHPPEEDDLSRSLKTWRAPDAPDALEARLLASYRDGRWKRRLSWRWLLTGTVRVPLPVAAAVALVCAASLLAALRTVPRPAPSPGPPVSAPPSSEPDGRPPHRLPDEDLAGFEPMKEMKVTILHRGDVR